MGKKTEKKGEKKKKKIAQRFTVDLHSETLSSFSFFLMLLIKKKRKKNRVNSSYQVNPSNPGSVL